MRLLIRLLLTVYPPSVRQRYGEEIAQLLRESRRPWRDTADVFWNGLGERVLQRPRVSWLIPVVLVATVVMWFREPALYERTLTLWMVVAAMAIGWRLGRRPADRWYQHPVAVTVCFGLVWFIPWHPSVWLRAGGFLAWVTGTLAVAWVVHRLGRRDRPRRAGAVAIAGWFLLLQVFIAGWHALLGLSGLDALPRMLLGMPVDLYGTGPMILLAPPFALALAYTLRQATRRPAVEPAG